MSAFQWSNSSELHVPRETTERSNQKKELIAVPAVGPLGRIPSYQKARAVMRPSSN